MDFPKLTWLAKGKAAFQPGQPGSQSLRPDPQFCAVLDHEADTVQYSESLQFLTFTPSTSTHTREGCVSQGSESQGEAWK